MPLCVLGGKESRVEYDLLGSGDKFVIRFWLVDKVGKDGCISNLADYVRNIALHWVPFCLYAFNVCGDVMWGWTAPFVEDSFKIFVVHSVWSAKEDSAEGCSH